MSNNNEFTREAWTLGWVEQLRHRTVLTISVTPNKVAQDGIVTISGKLTDGFGKGLGDRILDIYADRLSFATETENVWTRRIPNNNDGSFSLTTSEPQPEHLGFRAHFEGDSEYAESYSNDDQWATWLLPTKLEIRSTAWRPKQGEFFTVLARLTDQNNAPLKDVRGVKVNTWHKQSTVWSCVKEGGYTNANGEIGVLVRVTSEDDEPATHLFLPTHDDDIWDPVLYQATFRDQSIPSEFATYVDSDSNVITIVPDTDS